MDGIAKKVLQIIDKFIQTVDISFTTNLGMKKLDKTKLTKLGLYFTT